MKFNEIRITRIPEDVKKTVEDAAKQNKRTINKQALVFLELGIKKLKEKK